MRYHVIDYWRTPASTFPRTAVGEWAVTTQRREPGLYPMQDVGAFYYLPDAIDLTVISEGQRVWFTDEPRQMYALAEVGLFRARGRVIVGGLGLGLIQHFLALNRNVTHVLTIERAPEVVSLVWPYVRSEKLHIGDFYEVLPELASQGYVADTIITDFIFGYQTDETWQELKRQQEFCRYYFPEAQFLEHGFQRQLDAEVVNRELPPSSLVPPETMFAQVKIVR